MLREFDTDGDGMLNYGSKYLPNICQNNCKMCFDKKMKLFLNQNKTRDELISALNIYLKVGTLTEGYEFFVIQN